MTRTRGGTPLHLVIERSGKKLAGGYSVERARFNRLLKNAA
jgi:hypothetical protein